MKINENIFYIARDLGGEGYLSGFTDDQYTVNIDRRESHTFESMELLIDTLDKWDRVHHHFELIPIYSIR